MAMGGDQTMSEKDYTYVPAEQLAQLPDGTSTIQHFHNYWWAVHPEKGLAFWNKTGGNSPQCNSDERITRILLRSTPWLQAQQIEHVFVRVNLDGVIRLPEQVKTS
jgi:hypothetical protein